MWLNVCVAQYLTDSFFFGDYWDGNCLPMVIMYMVALSPKIGQPHQSFVKKK